MNRFRIKALIVASVLTLLSACKISPPITVDYDINYDYSNLRSYAWAIPKDASKVTTLDNRRQIIAIETNLNRKGFNKIEDSSQADFLLRTHTITDKKTNIDSFYSIWGYHPYSYHHFYGWPHHATTVIREYEVGTLVLDIVDPIKKEVIWRGSVSRKLGIYQNRTHEERESIALTNATFLLESFPPGGANQSSKSN